MKPVIAAADNTVSFSLLAVVNPCSRGEAQSLVVVCVAAAGEVVGVLGGRGDEAEGTVLGTDVVASALVIVAWAAFVFELVEVPSIVSAFEPVFKLAFARNFSFASCSIAISFS